MKNDFRWILPRPVRVRVRVWAAEGLKLSSRVSCSRSIVGIPPLHQKKIYMFAFNVHTLAGPREFEAHTVNVVSQWWLNPEGRAVSLEQLARSRRVPFPRSVRCVPNARIHNVSFGVFKRSYKLRRTVAGIRSSGVVTHAGARTEAEALLAAQVAALVLVRDAGLDVTCANFKIKNVVTVCNLGVQVSLDGLQARLGNLAAYARVGEHKFPMVRFPSKLARARAPCRSSISRRGVVVVVGSPDRREIVRVLEAVVPATLVSAPGADLAALTQQRLPHAADDETRKRLDLLPPTIGMDAVADMDGAGDDDDDAAAARMLAAISAAFQSNRLLQIPHAQPP